jgi:hypothetical protein
MKQHPALDTSTIREHFERDGWVFVPRLLKPREIEALRVASDELAAKGAHLLADAEIDGARYQVQSASGRRGESAVVPGALRKIVFASSASEKVALLRNDPRILKLVESVGVSARRWIVDQINLKAPMVGTGFPWHQDVAFVAWQQRNAIAQHGGASPGIALDRADETIGELPQSLRSRALAYPPSAHAPRYTPGRRSGAVNQHHPSNSRVARPEVQSGFVTADLFGDA